MNKTYTFDETIISDLHKDAYGYRPSEQFWRNWDAFTDDQKQSEWEYLLVQLDQSIKREEAQTAVAIAEFEESIRLTIEGGAADRSTATRWLMEACEEANGDVEFFEYLNGIPYGYISKTA